MMVNGDPGDAACDHYRRWRGDIDLMTRLSVQARAVNDSDPRRGAGYALRILPPLKGEGEEEIYRSRA